MISKNRLYDRRVIDRYREKGMLKETEVESYLKNLPDETANAQWVQIDLYEAEMGDSGEPSSSSNSGDNHHDDEDDERDSEEEH